jgi:hypothetical protein
MPRVSRVRSLRAGLVTGLAAIGLAGTYTIYAAAGTDPQASAARVRAAALSGAMARASSDYLRARSECERLIGAEKGTCRTAARAERKRARLLAQGQ